MRIKVFGIHIVHFLYPTLIIVKLTFFQLPQVGDLWSCYVDFEARRMDTWERIVPMFKYNPETPFFEMLVPTMDTVRFGYLLEKLLQIKQSVLFTGGTGIGKVSKTVRYNCAQ